MEFSYSVVIRTLGNTGEKYQRLLQSIEKQSVKPEEIIVAIPEGYDLDFCLGYERIVRCKKGMTAQRAAGINVAKSDYILVVDDDVAFDESMVEELYDYLNQNGLDCCLPMSGESCSETDKKINLFYPLKTRLRNGFTGQMLTSRRKSDYLDVLTYTAGHKVYVNSNDLDKCYLCTTACFQCFFIKTSLAQMAHFEEEIWLDEGTLSHYAAFDEPVFFRKLSLIGFRMAYSLRTRYQHLDGSVGHVSRTKLEAKSIRYYSIARNRTIYWYKFIWMPSGSLVYKAKALFGGVYGVVNYTILTVLLNLNPYSVKSLKALFKGYKDASCYIRNLKK